MIAAGPSPRRAALVTAAVVLPLLLGMGLCWPYSVDDAFILFRYGRHLAEGAGLTFNPGAAPVEGYSNILYVVVTAALIRSGIDPLWVMKALGAVAAVGCLPLTYALGRAVGLMRGTSAAASMALSLFSGFAFWAVAGLETTLFTALITLGAYLFLRRGPQGDVQVAAAFVVASLLRPEGPVFVAALCVVRLVQSRSEGVRAAVVRAVKLGLLFGLPFGAYFAARWAYFGLLFPNPIYLKAGGLSAPGSSVMLPFLAAWAPVVAAAVAAPFLRRDARVLTLAALCAAGLLSYAQARTEVDGTVTMAFFDRFLLPIVPALLVLAGAAVETVWARGRRFGAYAAGAASIVWLVVNPVTNLRTTMEMVVAQRDGVAGAGTDLISYLTTRFGREHRVAIGDVGAVGYAFPGTIYDLYGLNDYRFAVEFRRDTRRFVDAVLAQDPDAVVVVAREAQEEPAGLATVHLADRAVLEHPDFRARYAQARAFRQGDNPWGYVVFERIPAPK